MSSTVKNLEWETLRALRYCGVCLCVCVEVGGAVIKASTRWTTAVAL